MHAAIVGTYPPTRCGIATFTADVESSLHHNGATTTVVPVEPGGACIDRDSRDSYVRAAHHLNDLGCDVVVIEHEFGIFGGVAGSHILGYSAAPGALEAHSLIGRAEAVAAGVAALRDQGVSYVLVNGHGGNYVLSNVVQEANVSNRCMALFPTTEDWKAARSAAQMESSIHEDMHAGEAETSILLHVSPEVVRPGYETADWLANDRPHLLSLGMSAYTTSGVIGRPRSGLPRRAERR